MAEHVYDGMTPELHVLLDLILITMIALDEKSVITGDEFVKRIEKRIEYLGPVLGEGRTDLLRVCQKKILNRAI